MKKTVLKTVLLIGITILMVSCSENSFLPVITTIETELTEQNDCVTTYIITGISEASVAEISEQEMQTVDSSVTTTEMSVHAKILVDHTVRFVMTEAWLESSYEFTDENIFRFIVSLRTYREDSDHPYSNMIDVCLIEDWECAPITLGC